MAASGNKRSGRKAPVAGSVEIPGIGPAPVVGSPLPIVDAAPVEAEAPLIEWPIANEPAVPSVLARQPGKPAPRVRAPKPVAKPAVTEAPAPVAPEAAAPVEAVVEPVEAVAEPVVEAVTETVAAVEAKAEEQVTEVAETLSETVETVADQAVATTETTTAAVEDAATTIRDTASAAHRQQEKTIMDTIQNATEKTQAMFGEANERAKGAYEKGTKFFQEMTEFSKGNVEAIVESSKIAAKGFESMGQDTAAYLKTSFEDATQAMRTLATIKSPTELMKFQADYVRSAFDALVAQTSRGTEASLKLAGEVAQPISNRVAVAAEKIKVAA